jgi:hypothetical protein
MPQISSLEPREKANAAQSGDQRQSTGPASGDASGSRETDTVSNSSAAFAFWPGFESGSGRDQADTLVIGSSAEGAVDRCCPRLRLDYAIFGSFSLQAAGIGFYEPKALYIDE